MSDLASRLARHEIVSAALAELDDAGLRALLAAAPTYGHGIGGRTVVLEVAGSRAFVKQVRLTGLEREHERSTANLHGMPMRCHYGVGALGSPGFGAWRELAVQEQTSRWVEAGEHEGFPLLHHWRVLADDGHPLPEELADVERAVEHWGGSEAVRRRLEDLASSTASIVLVLEHLPHDVHSWLGQQVDAGGVGAERAVAMVEAGLEGLVSFVGSRDLLHLDVHFQNLLTDGQRLYLADHGLALSGGFELEPEEAAFLDSHRGYDRAFASTHLVNWLAVALHGLDPDARRAFVEACARGEVPASTSPALAAVLLRHALAAAVMGDFYRRFQQDRSAAYPAEELRRLTAGGAPP